MLIDNVVELVLHQHAQDKKHENESWGHASQPRHDIAAVSAALGPRFDAKVTLARLTGLLSSQIGEAVSELHGFRNTAYHGGLRHEGILHSLALFYFDNAPVRHCGPSYHFVVRPERPNLSFPVFLGAERRIDSARR
jgi:hypothetical protein